MRAFGDSPASGETVVMGFQRCGRPRVRLRIPLVVGLMVPLLVPGLAGTAEAQLVSPGKLAAPHRNLEGLRNCTNCHELGKRGAANDRCLACHEPLAKRVARALGYHATVTDRGCGSCHKDHFGVGFALTRLDTTRFDHGDTGYQLAGSHVDLGCHDCHRAEYVEADDVRAFKRRHGALDRTLLGLGNSCESCHREDSPHGRQFARRKCIDCHGEGTWGDVTRFDHDRTGYRLTGLHRRVSCDECHQPLPGRRAPYLQYEGIPFASCTSCHRDVHEGSMGATCTKCHSTTGWRRIDRSSFEGGFDHSVTGFALRGQHARVECMSCHASQRHEPEGIHMTLRRARAGTTYLRPVAETCVSCHLDYHDGVFAATTGGIVCENCHTEDAWSPTTYGLQRHNREAAFELTGAHLVTPCFACHDNPELGHQGFRAHFESRECESCHEQDDPHETQFIGQACTSCHDTQSFHVASFDHAATRFPLDGAHREVPCASCHPEATTPGGATARVYKPLGTECRDCHGGKS